MVTSVSDLANLAMVVLQVVKPLVFSINTCLNSNKEHLDVYYDSLCVNFSCFVANCAVFSIF